MKKYIYILLLLSTIISCTSKKEEYPEKTIYVSIEPLRYFAESIAGDKFTIKTLVRQGASPETYEPTAEQMQELAKCCMYIKVGELGFEKTWLKRIIKNAPHTIINSASDGIDAEKSVNGIPDPHTWMSTANATIIAENICRYMINIDNSDSVYFKDNLEKLRSRIEATDTKVRKILENTSVRSFVIYHPALTYYARDFMLSQIPIEEEGREPSVAQLQDIILKAKQLNINTVFVQKEFSDNNAQIIAKGINAQIKPIEPLSYHWEKEMINIANLLK